MGAEQRAAMGAATSDTGSSVRIGSERGEVTARRLRRMVEQYRPRLGDFEVITVGENAGFIVKKMRPQVGVRDGERDTFLGDFDDAIGATTAIKGKPGGEDVGKPTRFDWYRQYMQRLGREIGDEQVKEVIDKTDAFSRWEHVPAGGPIYHQREHATVLTWATERLISSTGADAADIVADIVSTLDRIKSGETDPSDPFRFNQHGQLVMTNIRSPWIPYMEDLFMNTMIKPPYYPEVLDAMKLLGNTEGTLGMDLVGMTHGDPTEQLRKFFEMLCEDPDLPIEEIWLTQIGKGDFVRQVAKERGLRRGVYIHFDDSRRHIEDTVGFSDQFGGVLSVRDETKEGKALLKQSGPVLPDQVAQGRVSVIRFSDGDVTAQDIVDQVQWVRHNVRSNMDRRASPQQFGRAA